MVRRIAKNRLSDVVGSERAGWRRDVSVFEFRCRTLSPFLVIGCSFCRPSGSKHCLQKGYTTQDIQSAILEFHMSSASSGPSGVPSELKLSKAWDLCIERGIYRTVVGTLIGGMAAVVLFRKLISLSLRQVFYNYALLRSIVCQYLLRYPRQEIRVYNVRDRLRCRFGLGALGNRF